MADLADIVMDEAALNRFLEEFFQQVAGEFTVEEVTSDGIRIRLVVQDKHLRPGGTVSGPSMFALADVAVYLAILARIGPKALSVTTSAALDFMRKPVAHADLVAETRLLKLGRVLAVGDVLLYSDGMAQPVARASMTYSIPPAG
ncbi:PaaI family thioesterase [Mesobacterium pallidum]|uniref:PaaI family thioesterase n=1 Tax=Mesobacterium pallidum TaxID=2872037 RepID=UPI001EE1EC9C|nr:PaaI family thioesterase [Mesobacterium pallidum]